MRALESGLVDLCLPVSRAIADVSRLAQARLPYEVVPNFAEDPAPRRRARAADRRLDEHPRRAVHPAGRRPARGQGRRRPARRVRAARRTRRRSCSSGRDDGRFAGDWPAGVISTGPLPHDARRRAWRRSLFGTMPSLCLDASPTVTLEAMAAARPVVASARGGLLDQVVDGETGFLVPPGDAGALASAMARLLADERLRARLGAAAREPLRAGVLGVRRDRPDRVDLPRLLASRHVRRQ